MQSLRSVRTISQAVAQTKIESSTKGDPNRTSIESVRELIRAMTLVAEAAEQSLVSEFKFSDDFYDNVYRFEIIMIKRALRKAKGNQRKAAQLLGIKATTLNSKIKRYDIEVVSQSRPKGIYK